MRTQNDRNPPYFAGVDVIDWLMQGDPAIRWQVFRDLTDASDDQVAAERARVETEGWGARLLGLRDPDGQWVGGACFPKWVADQWRAGNPPDFSKGQPWTSTLPSFAILRELGLDPASGSARETTALVAKNCRWEHDGQAYFDGEVEACINGRTLATGAYFGADVDALCSGLLNDQLEDGGWNCETEQGSTVSSFHSTICVLEGLLEYERAGGSLAVSEARQRGEEYFLQRHLFRSKRTGEVIRQSWLRFAWPTQWHYDVLRGLAYFWSVGGRPDERIAEAVELLRDKQTDDGRWLMDQVYGGQVHFAFEGEGEPSRWNTLRALRLLRWYDATRQRSVRDT
jgi:hypothetical protein